jgi:hypothetical protein
VTKPKEQETSAETRNRTAKVVAAEASRQQPNRGLGTNNGPRLDKGVLRQSWADAQLKALGEGILGNHAYRRKEACQDDFRFGCVQPVLRLFRERSSHSLCMGDAQ